jgi:hypothetical protein
MPAAGLVARTEPVVPDLGRANDSIQQVMKNKQARTFARYKRSRCGGFAIISSPPPHTPEPEDKAPGHDR